MLLKILKYPCRTGVLRMYIFIGRVRAVELEPDLVGVGAVEGGY
jgi:hypothetical protein